MRKRRALKPGERRCPTCSTIVKDDLNLISSLPTIKEIIDATNDRLVTVRWFIDVNRANSRVSIGKLVKRRKKDSQLHVNEWWEAEFIIERIPSSTTGEYGHVIVKIKDWWKDHPTDTFSVEAKKKHHQMLEKSGEKI